MLSKGNLWGAVRNRAISEQMTYNGDVFDTPPVWIRILLGAACLAGGVLAIIHLVSASLVIPLIITCAALILAGYLLVSVATGAQVALVTIGFWAYLGVLTLILP